MAGNGNRPVVNRRSFSNSSLISELSSVSSNTFHTPRGSIDSNTESAQARASIASVSSRRSSEAPEIGYLRGRNDVLEDIAEENERILERNNGRRANKPFNWAEVGGKLAKLAKKEYEQSRKNREKHLSDWENRNRNLQRSHPDISRAKDEEFFSFGDSLKKDKFKGNKILDSLKESKLKRENRTKIKMDMEMEKQKLYDIAREDRRQKIEDLYPPPPYFRGGYNIPDSMYEELQLKRLVHGLYTSSDPEDTRRKNRIYPELPEEDYSYVRTSALREWAKDVRDDTAEGNSYHRNITRRPKLPTPRGLDWTKNVKYPGDWRELYIKKKIESDESLSSSSSEDEAQRPRKRISVPKRLKGGNSDSDSAEFRSDGELPTGTRVTPSGRLVRKRAETSPVEQEENKDKEETENMSKRRKEGETARRNNPWKNPGIREGVALEYKSQVLRLNAKLHEIITQEAGKKKLSISVVRDMQSVGEAYQELVNELLMENAVLTGRLMEARVSEEASNFEMKSMARNNTRTHKQNGTTSNAHPTSEDIQVTLDIEMEEATKSRNRRRKDAQKAKKKVRIADTAGPSRETVQTTDCETDGGFTEVRNNKKRRNKKSKADSDATSGGETDASSSRRQQRKKTGNTEKMSKLKETEPQKIFTVEVTDNLISTKKSLWADILKKTGAPKILRQMVVEKGEKQSLNIVAADDATYQALKSITEDRADVQQKPSKWPMLMIYDVDEMMTPNEIAHDLVSQNTALGSLVNEAATNMCRPLFKRGPRNLPTVWWVCEVRPDIHAVLLSAGRVYLGMSNCRVTEYFDFKQCFTCLKYGHRESFCKAEKNRCAHCGMEGHKEEACTRKTQQPKCANCKGNHVAYSKLCRERTKAIEEAVRRTDYKDPTCK